MSSDHRERSQSPAADCFYNPYTFIPTPPRDKVTGWAGDADPLTAGLRHDRLGADLWTGTIRVKMTVRTPLLLMAENPTCDHDCKPCDTSTHHKIYDVREDIPLPSIRGMLRSAYEAITNSRYGVFKTPRQGYRPPAKADEDEMICVVPFRVESIDSNGNAVGKLLLGDPTDNPDLDPAAWISHGLLSKVFVDDPHAREATAVLVPVERRRFNGKKRTRKPTLRYWRVVHLITSPLTPNPAQSDVTAWTKTAKVVADPNVSETMTKNWQTHEYCDSPPSCRVETGWIWASGRTFPSKHDERFCFGTAKPATASADLVRGYNDIVADYRSLHDAPKNKEIKVGHHMIALSRAVIKDPVLRQDALVLAAVDKNTLNMATPVIKMLRPVHISRRAHDLEPAALLTGRRLLPAASTKEMSPADRLFGWVGQSRKDAQEAAAYAGRLRICRPTITPPANGQRAVRKLDHDAMPLAILGAPKPAHGRFYVAESPDGAPQEPGRSNQNTGYTEGRGLRGRKQFWPHRNLKWELTSNGAAGTTPGFAPRQQDGTPVRSSQNRSIRGWIEPGTTISFDLELTNGTAEEIGGLIWLLSLNQQKNHHTEFLFRLGYGKPLGFGSVTLEAESISFHPGAEWLKYWMSFDADKPTSDGAGDFVKAFEAGLWKAYGQATGQSKPAAHSPFAALRDMASTTQGNTHGNIEEIGFIKAFLAVGRGPGGDHPVKYPHIANSPGSEQYRWFVANDRGPKHSLPDATDTNGTLPVL